MKNDLDKILATMQIEIQRLNAKVAFLTRELNARTSGGAAAKARRIPIAGEKYYIQETGDAYLKNVYGKYFYIWETGNYYRFAISSGALIVEYSSTGGDPWATAAEIAVP